MADSEYLAAAGRRTTKIGRIDQTDAPIPDSDFSRPPHLGVKMSTFLPPPKGNWQAGPDALPGRYANLRSEL